MEEHHKLCMYDSNPGYIIQMIYDARCYGMCTYSYKIVSAVRCACLCVASLISIV